MRIIAWNCNMSLGRKLDLVMALAPDVLILQEVSKRDVEKLPAAFKHWVGANPHKGLAVVAFGGHACRTCERYTDELPWFIPVEIPELGLNILGVWAHVKTPVFRYVRVLHAAIEHYQAFLTCRPTILAGDFNSNTFWDKKHAKSTHTMLVAKLDALGFKSLYHESMQEDQGKELTHTWYMYRNRAKGYHLDYIFMPQVLLERASLVVGHPDDWLSVSDHMPLIAEISGYDGRSDIP